MTSKLKTFEQICRKTRLPVSMVLENLLPVVSGSRHASIVYLDNFDVSQIHPKKGLRDGYYAGIKRAIEEFGIGARKTNQTTEQRVVIPRIIFYSAPHLPEVEALIGDSEAVQSGFNGSCDSTFVGVIKKEGRLLGVPECCSETFATVRIACYRRRETTHQENRIKQQLQDAFPTLTLDAAGDAVLGFWANEIYPCSISCQPARDTGRRILESFEDPRLAEVYRTAVMFRNLRSCRNYNTPSSGFGTVAVRQRNYERDQEVFRAFLGQGIDLKQVLKK